MDQPDMSNVDSTPDLQTILATLARFAPPQPAQPTTKPAPDSVTAVPPSSTTQAREDPTPPKPIDPATITNWRDALRCVTKIASQNVQFSTTIRQMIQDQKSHEMRWYTERQNLKQTQANRSSSAAKAQSILASLNPSTSSKLPHTPLDHDAELAALDRKIYASQVRLDTAMSAELKRLGVPFFGTDPQLVVSDANGDVNDAKEERPAWSPVITQRQLTELRGRMVAHLEDLYKD